MKNRILSFIAFILVSGCSSTQSESNILEDISKENYTIFVESYELYEERVETTNGLFVDAYGELIDFNEDGDVFADSDLLETAGEHCEKLENGEEGILTEIGDQLIDDFLSLYFIKQLDFMTEDMKPTAIERNRFSARPC